jgi:hypothetical protein
MLHIKTLVSPSRRTLTSASGERAAYVAGMNHAAVRETEQCGRLATSTVNAMCGRLETPAIGHSLAARIRSPPRTVRHHETAYDTNQKKKK